MEAASGLTLDAYFRQWLSETELPQLEVSHRSEAVPEGFRTVVDLRVRNLPGPIPLELSVSGEGGSRTSRVRLEPSGGSFPVVTPFRPRDVVVNGDRGLLGIVKETAPGPDRARSSADQR